MRALLFGDFFVCHAWGVKMVALIGKKTLETEDHYAAARGNIDKYCTYNAAVGEQYIYIYMYLYI